MDVSVHLDQSFEKCRNQLSNLIRTEPSKTIVYTYFGLFHRSFQYSESSVPTELRERLTNYQNELR